MSAEGEFLRSKESMGSDLFGNQQNQEHCCGLARYRTAPGSFLATLLESTTDNNSSTGDDSEALFSAFMDNGHLDLNQMQCSMKHDIGGEMGYVGSYSVGMESQSHKVNNNGSNLARQTSSPAGFLSDDRMSNAKIRAQLADLAKKRKKPEVGITIAEPGPSPPPKRSQKKKQGPGPEEEVVVIPDPQPLQQVRGKQKMEGSGREDPEMEEEVGHNVSFLSKPDGVEALNFVQHLVAPADLGVLQSAPDFQVEQSMALSLMQTMVWAGEYTSRAQADASSRSLDEVLARHRAVVRDMARLKEERDDELHALRLEMETARAGQEKAELENQELRSALKQKESEVAAAEELGKQKFLDSEEFVIICAEKALPFFQDGFKGCLAQFRANGYSEAEHPALFLDVDKAMEEGPEEGEVSEQGEGDKAEEKAPSPQV